jgi:hypothetical protein
MLGSAVNQDGRSSSLTAPNGPSQQGVVRNSLQHAGVSIPAYEQHEMHGTGTSLGDPIEVGALSAVLLAAKIKRGPLTLAAAKVTHGHAEAGAGIVGITPSLTSLTHAETHMVTNLRIVNPYVAETMGIASLTSAPREEIPKMSALAASGTASGISSFAYQGTNAHGTIGIDESITASLLDIDRIVWHKASAWLSPQAHPLASVVKAYKRPTRVTFHTMLSNTAGHAYLWDFRNSGVAVFAGAALVEMACASVHNVLNEAADLTTLAAVGMTIGAPAEMQEGRGAMPVFKAEFDLFTTVYEVTEQDSHDLSASCTISQLFAKGGAQSAAATTTASTAALLTLIRGTPVVASGAHVAITGSVGMDRTNIAQTGYRAHPAAVDSILSLTNMGRGVRAGVPVSLESFFAVGLVCSIKGLGMARRSADLSSPSDHMLHDASNRSGVALASQVVMRTLVHQIDPSLNDPRVHTLYVGTWQAISASTSPVVVRQKMLCVSAARSAPAGAHGVILVYDVTEQASFDHLASWIKDVDLYSGEEVRPSAS